MTFSDIFKSSFLESVTEFSPMDVLLGMVVALIVGLFIFVIYKSDALRMRADSLSRPMRTTSSVPGISIPISGALRHHVPGARDAQCVLRPILFHAIFQMKMPAGNSPDFFVQAVPAYLWKCSLQVLQPLARVSVRSSL